MLARLSSYTPRTVSPVLQGGGTPQEIDRNAAECQRRSASQLSLFGNREQRLKGGGL